MGSCIGMPLAPLTTRNGAVDKTPQASSLAQAKLLDDLRGHLHIAEADWDDAPEMPIVFKQAPRIIDGGTHDPCGPVYGWADRIGFGCPFLANPDLPCRLRHGQPLNMSNVGNLFGGAAKGLTGYPFAS